MNKRHKSIKFSFENKTDNSFSFLFVKICREKDKFAASVFRKDTFSGVYTLILVVFQHMNTNLALRRSFTIVSDFVKFDFEV